MKNKVVKIVALAAAMALAVSGTAMAGEWKQDAKGWWWQFEDGSYLKSRTATLDGNRDGIGEIYYFDDNGYMLSSTTTPDGGTVNAAGQLLRDDGSVLQLSVATSYVNEQPGGMEGYYVGDVGYSDLDRDGVKEEDYTIYYGYGVKVIDDNAISVLCDQFDNMQPVTYTKVADGVYERACPNGVDRITFSGSTFVFTCSDFDLQEVFKK